MLTISAILAIIFLVSRGYSIDYANKRKLIESALMAGCEKYGMNNSRIIVRRYWGLVLDIEKSLMVYTRVEKSGLKTQIIDLSQVSKCRILRKHTVSQPLFAIQKPREYLAQILLEIQLSRGGRYLIPFYDNDHDKLREMKILSYKARHMQRMIVR